MLDKGYHFFWDKIIKSADEKRMAKQTLPDGVSAILDIPYIDDGKVEHLLDIYFPEGAKEKLPVIIDMHGGGLMYGYKELNKNYCYHLVKRGFVVINISYSLSPENVFPAHIKDAMAALEWIGKNIDSYPICDKNAIFLTGDSGGGLLAAYSCLIATSEKLQQVFGVNKPDLTFKAAGFTSGMFYYEIGIAKYLIPGIFGKGGMKKSPYKEYIQLEDIFDLGSFPPSYMVTSTQDFIHDSTTKFKAFLDSKGVENEMDDFGINPDHKLEHVFSVGYPSEYEESVQTIDHMTDFFKKHI